jgi:hypothetical protein
MNCFLVSKQYAYYTYMYNIEYTCVPYILTVIYLGSLNRSIKIKIETSVVVNVYSAR